MIRAALVGVSGYGRWHLLMAMDQALRGRLTLAGVTVINAAQERGVCARLKRHGVPVFASFAAMMDELAGKVDLVLLPTAIQWHASMALAALRAGAHVLVEKPLAATLQDADTLIAAQAAARRLVAVGFQDLYVPATHDIKRRLLAGEIGAVRRIVVRGQWPRSTAYFARNGWAGRLRADDEWVLDSPAANAFAHFLMLALFWAGDAPLMAAPVAALEAELYRAAPIESFDTIALRARTGTGIEVLFYATHAGHEELPPEVQVQGESGSITWRYERTYTVEARGRGAVTLPVPDQMETRLSVLESVLDRLEGRPSFVVEPPLARVHTHLLNVLHAHCPIRDVPADWIDCAEARPGWYHRIRGLDALLAAAAAQGRLFHEAGAQWASPPTKAADCAAMRTFSGVAKPARSASVPA